MERKGSDFLDIYEKNRALNLKMKIKEFFEECYKQLGISSEDLYLKGEIFCLNNVEKLMINWILNGVSTDFAVFLDVDGEPKNFIHVNITKNSELVAYLHSENETETKEDEEENFKKNEEVTFLNSWKVPEYDARTFLNAIHINGDEKEKYNFTLNEFNFSVENNEYFDYINFWNGTYDIADEGEYDENWFFVFTSKKC